MELRVLLVDDHELFGDAIRWSLEDSDIEIVDVCTNGKDALDACGHHRPDVALLDLQLNDEDGIEVGEHILEQHPDIKVIALSGSEELSKVKAAFKSGFCGYITKGTSIARLATGIRSAANGDVITPTFSPPVKNASPTEEHAALLIRQLTAREEDVLRLLAGGASSGEMARQMSVSRNTVRTHVQNVLTKLQVHSRLEAAAFAVQNGLIDIPA